MSRLSIIIVSYNAAADLDRCLTSLGAAPPASAEVIVVDNASTDDSREVAGRHQGVQLVPLTSNVGFASGNNAGIQASRGELLLLLNSDTVVPAGAIDRLVGILDRHPEAAVVGPKLVDGNGVTELSIGPMIGPLAEWRQRRMMRALQRGAPWARAEVERLTASERPVDWVSGACLLVRRRDAEAVGFLDERFFMYTEDVDFCASIRARGRQVLFTPAVRIVHLRGRSAASAPAATRAAYERSHLAFYRKHHPVLAPLVALYHSFQARGRSS